AASGRSRTDTGSSTSALPRLSARSPRRDHGSRRPAARNRACARSSHELTPTPRRRRARNGVRTCASAMRQEVERVRRLAVLADLEMQFVATAALAHFGDRLAGFHAVAFLHETLSVVT